MRAMRPVHGGVLSVTSLPDEYVAEAVCTHEHGVVVCVDCGEPMPAPYPGHDLLEGELM